MAEPDDAADEEQEPDDAADEGLLPDDDPAPSVGSEDVKPLHRAAGQDHDQDAKPPERDHGWAEQHSGRGLCPVSHHSKRVRGHV